MPDIDADANLSRIALAPTLAVPFTAALTNLILNALADTVAEASTLAVPNNVFPPNAEYGD
jgi:hypothetical protein